MTAEDTIIDLLSENPLQTHELVSRVVRKNTVTKEAVYKSLRKLLKEEVIVKRGRVTSLSNQWVIDMAEKWRQAEAKYVGKPEGLRLAEKTSVVYTTKTIDELDTLWNHNIYQLVSLLPSGSHLYSSVPHYWFPSIRSKSEQRLMQTLKARGYVWHQMASNAKKLDRELKKYFPCEDIEYYAADIAEKNYINVFGEYVLEVTLDKKAAQYIEEWYETHSSFNDASICELEKVLAIRGVYKLKIAKNKTKAARYRKIFSPYFLVK